MNRTVAWPAIGEKVLLVIGALAISIVAGAFASKVDFVWVLAFLGVLLATVMVASREATLWFTLLTGLVISGVSQLYLADARYLKYLAPLAAAGLLLHVASEWLSAPRRKVPNTVLLFLVFLMIGMLSLGVNLSGIGTAVIGLKSYYPMWTLFLGLALIRWQHRTIDTLPKAALLLAVLQLPFVIHQYLWLVPMRQGVPGLVPVDVIAGTFGGDVWGGGANAVLSLFLIIVAACLLGLWRQGAIGGATAVFGTAVCLTPVALNSSRAALLYVPIVFALVLYSDVLRNPGRALVGLMASGVLIVGLLTAFTLTDPKARSWQDFVVQVWDNQLATERERADLYSGFTRITVLEFWLHEAQRMEPMEILVGHGPGATRVQAGDGLDLGPTLAERAYGGRQIGYTAVAAMLWEVGVLGLLAALALFWAAFRQAGQLARWYDGVDPVRSGVAQGLQAGVAILALSLAHKDFFAFHVPYQTLVACVLGYLAAQMNFLSRDLEGGGQHGVVVRE